MTRSLASLYSCTPHQIQAWNLCAGAVPLSKLHLRISAPATGDDVVRALREVLARHEALRTRVVKVPGLQHPVQDIVEADDAFLAIERTDARGWSADALDALAERCWRASTLSDDPGIGLRAQVIEAGATGVHLILHIPAICVDTKSLLRIPLELRALLAKERLDDDHPQYADVATWLKEELQGEDAAAATAQWQALRPLTLGLKLSIEEASAEDSDTGVVNRKLIFTSEALRAAPCANGRADALLLACYCILLARLANRGSVIVGVAPRVRPLRDLDGLVGLLDCFVPAGIELDDQAKLSALAASACRAIEAADARQLAWAATLGAQDAVALPFTFASQEANDVPPAGDARVAIVDLESAFQAAKVHCDVRCSGGETHVTLRFSGAHFGDVAVQWFERQFLSLVTAACGGALCQGDLAGGVLEMSPTEAAQWPDLVTPPCVGQESAEPVHVMFEAWAAAHPDRPAVSFRDQVWSYARLDAAAGQLAGRIAALADGNAIVGVYGEPSIALILGMLAVFKAGACYLPLDTSLPAARLKAIINDASPVVLLSDTPLPEGLYAGPVLPLSAPPEPGDLALLPTVGGEDIAYIIYTSGSTGRPKGVAISHRAISHYVHAIIDRLHLPAGATFGTMASPAADLGHTALFGALCGGGHFHVLPADEHLDAQALAKRLVDAPLDCLKIVPSHLAALIHSQGGEAILPAQCLVFGGEALTRDLARKVRELRPACRIINHYGPTETTVGATTFDLDQDDAASVTIPIGFPLPGYRLRIADAGFQPVRYGWVGELLIAGSALARGYLGQPEESALRFLADPQDASVLWYRTGDLVRLRANKAIEFVGRIDDQVKIRGFRIELGEIKVVLEGHDGISEAAAAIGANANGEPVVMAYAVAKPGSSLTSDALVEWLRTRLPAPAVPGAVILLDSLPLLPTGKVDRAALAQIDVRTAARDYVSPLPGLEQQIAAIWAELLGVRAVGRNDDFFYMGGHSLVAVRAATHLRRLVRIEMPIHVLFEHRTVAQLAEWIEERSDADVAAHAPIPQGTGDLPAPLSLAQQRLWILAQLEPDSNAFNISAALRIRGGLDTEALARAFGAIERRHAILRTGFVEHPDGVRQSVRAEAGIRLTVEWVTADQVEQRARDHASAPFALDEAPPIRVTLLRIDKEHHVLLICLHHILSDGWSSAIFTRELDHFYSAFVGDRDEMLPALPCQYTDYAAWQLDQMRGGAFEAGLAFWRAKLDGAPAMLTLPYDHPRHVVQSSCGGSVPLALPTILVAQLGTVARQQGVTLFMLLSAALRLVLARYSGQRDISIGTPVANRTHPDTEPLIGCFINALVLRGDVDPDATFADLLALEREIVLDALAHQHIPFEQVVDAVAPDRSLGHTPLFQVMIIFQTQSTSAIGLGGYDVDIVEISRQATKYDLTLDLREIGDTISGYLEYAADLFDRATAEGVARHYVNVLREIAAAPAVRLAEIAFMDDAEREAVERNLAGPVVGVDEEAHILRRFARQCTETPDAVAVVSGEHRMTYAELDARSNQLARFLADFGIARGAIVGISLGRGVTMVVAMLGILKRNCAYLPLDRELPRSRLEAMVADAGATAILTDSASAPALPAGPPTIVLDAPDQMLARFSAAPMDEPAALDDLAYVLFTSGSTGRPKGVMVDHGNLANFLVGMDRTIPGAPGVWLACTSLSFDISVLELLWTLSRGFTTVVQRRSGMRAPRAEDGRGIDFGLFYFGSHGASAGNDPYRLLMQGAAFADCNGFSSVWTPERHFGAFGGLYPNATVTSAALAATTSRIGIRAGSLVLPLHDPVRVAEDWAMIDNLSGGRVGLSFATGWHANDFVLAPDRFQQRREVLAQDMETVRRLWRGEAVDRVSGTGETVSVRTLPRPVQPELPLWITTTGSEESVRKAARAGANLLTHLLSQSIDELAARIQLYRRERRDAGHAGTGIVSVMVHTFVADSEEEARSIAYGPLLSYLKQSADLASSMAGSRGLDLAGLSISDLDELLEQGARRYFDESGLIGPISRCIETVARLKVAGVDEIACLVDFGIDADMVLARLPNLAALRAAAQSDGRADDAIEELVSRYGVTHFQCTPTVARMLLAGAEGRAALRALDCLVVGGEAMTNDLASDLRREAPGAVFNAYGPTETTIWSTIATVDDGPARIGSAIVNTTLLIVDEWLHPQPIGLAGELLIGGLGVARGYIGNTEETARRFLASGPPSRPVRLYRTGDRVRYRYDGSLEFLGRIDNQVKVRGFRIELNEVEAALLADPTIAQAAVLVAPNRQGVDQLIAYVVPANGTFDVTACRARAGQTLPEYAVPTILTPLESLPLTVGGKVDRVALRSFEAPRAVPSRTEPNSSAELLLVELWSELLGTAEFGVDDNFFALGGDSVIALQLVAKARRRGISLSPRLIFQHQTIAELAAVIQIVTAAEPAAGDEKEAALTPIQHWFFEQELADPQHYNQAILLQVEQEVTAEIVGCAFALLTEAHLAFRLRFRNTPEGWRQVVHERADAVFKIVSLDSAPATDQFEALQQLLLRTHAGLDFECGPVIRAVWIDRGEGRPPLLLLAAHHLVVDGLSWRILVDDLERLSRDLACGRTPAPLEPAGSTIQWARRLAAIASDDMVLADLEAWEHLLAGERAEPAPDMPGSAVESSARTLSFKLDRDETSILLHDAPRLYRSAIRDAVLSAMLDAFESWTGRDELVLDLEGHGREEIDRAGDLSQAVGWYTSLFPARLRRSRSPSPGARMKIVRDQLAQLPSNGLTFGILKYLSPDPAVRARMSRLPMGALIFNYLGQADQVLDESAVFSLADANLGNQHAPSQVRKHALNVNALVQAGELLVHVTYSGAQYRDSSIGRFVDAFRQALLDTVQGCREGEAVLSPTDFKNLAIGQEDLDQVLAELRELDALHQKAK